MPGPAIVFRADGSAAVGLGHVTRCLALAQAFANRQHRVVFAGAVPEFLRHHACVDDWFDVPNGMAAWDDAKFAGAVGAAGLLVTDSYLIDAAWQRKSTVPLVAITDPPLREQHCDLLLLPTVFQHDGQARTLCGPEHCLIRHEIVRARSGPKSSTAILVSCGGGDDKGLTSRIVEAITSDASLRALRLTVVLGVGVARAPIEAMTEGCQNAMIVSSVTDMAALINDHDIAVGTPSGGALERACLGLAQLLIPIADNQVPLGDSLARCGAALTLSPYADATAIAAALNRLVSNAARRQQLAASAYALIDGQGAERVVSVVEREIFRA